MAELIKREWRSGPRKVRKVAWGYTLQVKGRQERRSCATWTEDDARVELVKRQEELRVALPRPCQLHLSAPEQVPAGDRRAGRKHWDAEG